MPGIAGWARCAHHRSPPPSLQSMLDALSRPWYRIEQYANKTETVSLGCADLGVANREVQPYTTPDQSISVCLYGNIYSPSASASTILSLIANAYRDKGLAFLNDLQGEFFLVVVDHNHQRLILANDRYGRRPVYYSFQDDQLIFSSTIKSILASGTIKPSVDEEALADFLCFAFIPGERTLLHQVLMLPPATALGFDLRSGELATNRYWDLRQHLQPSPEPEAYLLDRLSETFRAAVERRLSPSRTNWLSLSAGMDSRTIAAVMNTEDAPVKAVTSGVQGGYERKVTSRIASTIGVDHLFYTFNEAQLTHTESEFTDLVREAIALTDGMRGTASSAMTAFSSRQRRNHGLETVITGHGGEIAKLDEAYNLAIRTQDDIHKLGTRPVDWTFERLRRPNAPRYNTPALYKGELSRAFADTPKQHLQAILGQLDRDVPPAQCVSFLFLNELYRKRASYALAVQRAYVEIHVPFYDDDFLATVIGAPLSLRSNYRIHRHIIKKNCPELLNIVLSETRMRPFPSAAERLFRGLPYTLAKRIGLFKRDIPEHYFAANANLDFFRHILQDPRTIDRGAFNSDEVSRLIDALSQGQRSANTLLHLLTLVELWHRDFIDTL